jgi:hypothetical protein
MDNKGFNKMSDEELAGLLASLKREMAAPPDFRAKIVSQIVGTPVEAPARWSFAGFFFRRSWFLAAGAAAAVILGLWQGMRIDSAAKASHLELTETKPVLSAASRPSIATGSTGVTVLALAAKAKPARQTSHEAPAVASKPEQANGSSAAMVQASLPRSETASLEKGAGNSSTTSQQQKSGVVVALPAQPPLGSATSSQGTSQFGSSGAPAASSSVKAASLDKPTVVVIEASPTPLAKSLEGNSQVRRNKFEPSKGEYALILFQVKSAGTVLVEIFDRLGRRVTVLQDASMPEGLHEIRWAGHDDQGQVSPTGIYLVRIKTHDYDERHKMVLVR